MLKEFREDDPFFTGLRIYLIQSSTNRLLFKSPFSWLNLWLGLEHLLPPLTQRICPVARSNAPQIRFTHNNHTRPEPPAVQNAKLVVE